VFESHVRYLVRHCSPVGAQELLAAIDGSHQLPRRAVLVTFDDGYRDFAEFAWPLLKQYRVPCILFVSTAFSSDPSRPFWWDALWQIVSRTTIAQLVPGWFGGPPLPLRTEDQRARAYRLLSEWLKGQSAARRRELLLRYRADLDVQPNLTGGPAVLSWQELRVLATDGLVVAAHGRSHELLDQVDAATLDCEVSGSQDDLARHIGSCVPLFAYPNGNVNARVVRALGDAGFVAGFTTVGGLDTLPTRRPLLLRREQARGSLFKLVAKLTPPIARWRTARKALPPVEPYGA
jgi:peptidoglycan/xylan/chitin deacetylase (PgdA/CDA1 family)